MSEAVKRRAHLEDICINDRIILKWILNNSGECGGFGWLRMAMLGSRGIYIGLEEGEVEGVGSPLPSMATSALKMETVCFSEMSVSTDESTRRQNLEEHHRAITNSKPVKK
jgi:hypothetical protein